MEKEVSLLSFDKYGRVIVPGSESDNDGFSAGESDEFRGELKTGDSLEFLKEEGNTAFHRFSYQQRF